MASYSDVVFIPARCNKTGKEFFVREDVGADGMWVRTYGVIDVPNGGAGIASEGVVDMDNLRVGPQYKCPHCGNRRVFYCKECGVQICCFDGGDTWNCPVTGESGTFGEGVVSTLSGKAGKSQ